MAIEQINRRRKMKWKWSIVLTWIGINSLGIATHYFFALALVIEFLVVLGFWFWATRYRSLKAQFRPLATLDQCRLWHVSWLFGLAACC